MLCDWYIWYCIRCVLFVTCEHIHMVCVCFVCIVSDLCEICLLYVACGMCAAYVVCVSGLWCLWCVCRGGGWISRD